MNLQAERRVLIDATGASIGGGYTYLVNVVPRLCAAAPKCNFRVLVRSARLAKAMGQHSNLEVIELPEVWVGERLRHTYFVMPGIARNWRADLFFSVGEVAPLFLSCPSIASFRNAHIFTEALRAPNLRDWVRFKMLRLIARLAAWQCDRIMFVSHDSASWIGDSISLPESRRAVIHHGIDRDLWSSTEPYRGHPRPYILSVSSIYHYKNFVRLIRAYTEVAKRNETTPDLIIIGDEYDQQHREEMETARVEAGDLAERIHILGSVAYEEIKAYYRGAVLFVFPSYLETFGHPLLEAMVSGLPVVAADIASFREIADDSALFAKYDDVSSIATCIEEALDPDIAADLVRRGSGRIREFSWDHSVERLLVLFDEVINESHARGRFRG